MATKDIILRCPRHYNIPTPFSPPELGWLEGTWSVTHSTLPMWRKTKNVLITYKILAPASLSALTCLDDEVSSVPTSRTWMPQPKSIRGVDTPDGHGGWDWRGRGWLKIASSHWEILGWGERDLDGQEGKKERWVVTWFAPSLFTPAGLDIYSDRREGLSEGTYQIVIEALKGLEAKDLVELVQKEMRKVKIE